MSTVWDASRARPAYTHLAFGTSSWTLKYGGVRFYVGSHERVQGRPLRLLNATRAGSLGCQGTWLKVRLVSECRAKSEDRFVYVLLSRAASPSTLLVVDEAFEVVPAAALRNLGDERLETE